MKLSEFIKYIYVATVEITNFIDEKNIYFGSVKVIKKNLDIFKNYDIVGVFGTENNNSDLKIYVTEEKTKNE